MIDLENRRHALYRFYDAAERLLYVGITADLGGRLNRHGQDKPWWADVARVSVEHFDTRQAVLAAERDAILQEKPLHNIYHNHGGAAPLLSAPIRYARPPMLQPGHVVALALDAWKCPVGIVTDSDREGALLDLYSWMTGYFSAGDKWVRYSEIRMLRFAEHMPLEVARRLGYLVGEGDVIWDMDPLAEFQDNWKPKPLTDGDIQTIQERLSRPGYVGPFLDPPPDRALRPTPGVMRRAAPAVPDSLSAVPDLVPDSELSGTDLDMP